MDDSSIVNTPPRCKHFDWPVFLARHIDLGAIFMNARLNSFVLRTPTLQVDVFNHLDEDFKEMQPVLTTSEQ